MVNFKRNQIIIFYSFFTTNLILIYITVYLPIFFYNVLSVDKTLLAIVLLLAYLPLLLRPIFGIYFDKKQLNSLLKIIIFAGSIGTVCSFIFFLFNVTILFLFGVFLAINFLFTSLLEVLINKVIIDISADDKLKVKNSSYMSLGRLTGAIIPPIIFSIMFLFIYSNIYSLNLWNLFFLSGIILTIPIIFIAVLFKSSEIQVKLDEDVSNVPISKKAIILMCIFGFLSLADKLFEYPAEPWILEHYGIDAALLSLGYLLLVVVTAIFLIVAGNISNKFNQKYVLIVCVLISGTFFIIAPFLNLIGFFICFIIIQIFYAFYLVNMYSIMIEISKKRVFLFQIMILSLIIAQIVYVPLGIFLSGQINVELIFLCAGILMILSSIPLFLLKIQQDE